MSLRPRPLATSLALVGGALVVLATTAGAARGSLQPGHPTQGEDPRLEQLQAGWEVYRIWCSACHAYSGEGLTPAWISTWGPQDQNCWQSKCHAVNHPDDGFYLPHDIPAIVGPGVLDHFGDGPTLLAYVSRWMPYQEPGVLSDEKYYAVLAHVLNMNGIDYGPEPLSAQTLRAVVLGGGADAVLPTPLPADLPEPHRMPPSGSDSEAGGPRPTLWWIGLLASLGLACVAAAAVAFESRPNRE